MKEGSLTGLPSWCFKFVGSIGIKMKTILKIEEMSCKHCVQHVHEAIVQNSNVSAVDVSLEKGQAVMTWKTDLVELDSLLQKLKEAGYPAKVIASF